MFTCISCRVAFESAAEQRVHFATDWHRYNMKRRVANLPPVVAELFNEKVIERREQNAVRADPRGMTCRTCRKTFSTENAYRSHVSSKRHRDREAVRVEAQTLGEEPEIEQVANEDSFDRLTSHATRGVPAPSSSQIPSDSESNLSNPESGEESDIQNRIASSRRRIKSNHCLFCSARASTLDDIVLHMSRQHSFFIPDRDNLIDLPGLLSYLGEKVVIGNLCLYCPNGGREFASLAAARQHMIDKAHCKVAFHTEEDKAELSEYYGFEVIEGDEWEDMSDDEAVPSAGSEHHALHQDHGMSLADDGFSLVLPTGRVIGHRALRVYYAQRLRAEKAATSKDNNHHRIQAALADPGQALVSVAGGHGAFGRGLQTISARNSGEAKWAKRQANSFKDQSRREQMRTRVGMIHNNQKHFRDPLLQ